MSDEVVAKVCAAADVCGGTRAVFDEVVAKVRAADDVCGGTLAVSDEVVAKVRAAAGRACKRFGHAGRRHEALLRGWLTAGLQRGRITDAIPDDEPTRRRTGPWLR